MPELNLSNLLGRKKRGINFITVKTDYTSAVLSNTINYGLLATFILMLVTWGLLGYEYYLRGELNTWSRKVDEVGAQVQEDMDRSVEEVAEGEVPMRFETKFLATKQKLKTYGELLDDEKMVDMFGLLSAIVPDGVRISNLSIQPHFIAVTLFISQGREQTDMPLKQFAANLREVNNATFQDGKKLHIDETDISKITMAADSAGSSGMGYEMAVSFSYDIITSGAEELVGTQS